MSALEPALNVGLTCVLLLPLLLGAARFGEAGMVQPRCRSSLQPQITQDMGRAGGCMLSAGCTTTCMVCFTHSVRMKSLRDHFLSAT